MVRKKQSKHGTRAQVNRMDDLISRQAAIDALDKRFDSIPMEQTTEILQLRKDLRELPSAQSEIIRCKDCKHFEYDHPYIIRDVPILGHEVCNAWGDGCKTSENGYCFLAERRTDDDNVDA